MTKIHLALKSPDHIFLTVEVGVYSFINLVNGAFEVTTPMGDDWLQNRTFDLKEKEVSVTDDKDSTNTLTFKDQQTLQAFLIWLVEAVEAAREGYRTMRG